jgi:hypothetical protein
MRLPKTVTLPNEGTVDFSNVEHIRHYLRTLNQDIRTAFRFVQSDYNDVREFVRLLEQSADPPEPAAGKCIIWLSDGTGKGDAGDVMIASNVGGTTKYGTLFDYSGGTPW